MVEDGKRRERRAYCGGCDPYGRREGFGSETWKEQEQSYEGTFARDAYHGEGRYRWLSGKEKTVFEGHFYSNCKEGYGQVSLPDGSVFEGLFSNDRAFGPGIRTQGDGRQDVGFWRGRNFVRLSRAVDFIVPRLASTARGKLSLLRFQKIMPSLEERDMASVLQAKYGIDDDQRRRLYSNLIQDPRSIFFNRPHFEKVYFEVVDERCDSFVDETDYSRREPCPRDCDSSPAEAEGEAEAEMGILRYHAIHKTLDGFPGPFPGGFSALPMRGEWSDDEDQDVAYLLSWNQSELCMDMLKHIFRFRSLEDRVSFKVADLMSCARTKFRKTGDVERVNIHFLKMCALGPAVAVKELLCSEDISEELMDGRGNNSVMFAAAVDKHEIIEILLNRGVDVNAFNDECLTPLNLTLLRRLAEGASLRNWEGSFLPRDGNFGEFHPPGDGTWRMMSSITSLDRIFGDGMSAFECEDLQEKADGTTVFPNDSSDGMESDIHYEDFVGGRVEESSRGRDDGPPLSYKREEFSRSVAKDDCEYFFNLKPLKNPPERTGGRGSHQDGKEVEDSHSLSINEKLENVDKTIELLLKRGADPNLCVAPRPSLHLAVFSKDLSLVRLLLMYGASPDSRTLPQEGSLTPLHVLVLMKPEWVMLGMCELLLNHGASPEEETTPDFDPSGEDGVLDAERGRTPLQLLCTRRDAEYVDPEGVLPRLACLLLRVSKKDRLYRGHSYVTLAMVFGNHTLAKALHVLLSMEMKKKTSLECDLQESGADPNMRCQTLAATCFDYDFQKKEKERMKRKSWEKETKQDYLEDHANTVEHSAGKRRPSGDGNKRRSVDGDRKQPEKKTKTEKPSISSQNGRSKTGINDLEAKTINARKTNTKETTARKLQEESKEKVKRGAERRPPLKQKVEPPEEKPEKTRKASRTERILPIKSRGIAMTADRTQMLPERLRQSLLNMFGCCSGRFNLNDLLLPYVVLRNGDLYYRFKGGKPTAKEQYSLI